MVKQFLRFKVVGFYAVFYGLAVGFLIILILFILGVTFINLFCVAVLCFGIRGAWRLRRLLRF